MPKVPFPGSRCGSVLAPILLIAAFSIMVLLLMKEKQKPPDEAWSGPFYSNPDDPSVFVPKRYGIGYTLNFGNPWSWVVLILILILAIAPLFLSGIFLHRLPR